jgi:DNA-binding MarR family transcriptional regulator
MTTPIYRGLWKDVWPAAAPIATTCRCDQLRRAARVVTTIYDDWLAESGLRLPQLTILVAVGIAGADRIGVSRLAERVEADRTTTSRNVAVLVRRELLAFYRRPHGRGRVLEITPAGANAVAAALPLWKEAQSYVVSRLGAEDAATTEQVLRTLVALRLERFEPVPESG